MCSRLDMEMRAADLVAGEFPEILNLALSPGAKRYLPGYNTAPTMPVLVLVAGSWPEREGEGFQIETRRWGLVPPWAKELRQKYATWNATIEKASVEGIFAKPFQERRCVVFASGFYEWKPGDPLKRPYLFRPAEGKLLGFAGLWEIWRSKEAGKGPVFSCSILTQAAAPEGVVAKIHHRSPILLPPEAWKPWADPAPRAASASMDMLHQFRKVDLTVAQVGKRVNSVKNQGPDVLQPEA